MKNLFMKSLLFEVVNKEKPDTPEQSFALGVPPESIEHILPQRISRTKTFGGVFEDDYGPDNERIVIQGHNGGIRVWPCLKGKTHFIDVLEGRQAMYYFRDYILKYKSLYPEYTKYELRLYDLSTSPDISVTKEFTDAPIDLSQTEGFVVSLDDVKITRNKDRPLFYNYSIELTVLRSLGDYKPGLRQRLFYPSVTSLMVAIRKLVNTVKAVYGFLRTIRDAVDDVLNLLTSLERAVAAFYSETVSWIVYPAVLAKQVLAKIIALGTAIYNIPDTLKKTGTYIAEKYLSIADVFRQTVQAGAAIVAVGKSPDIGQSTKISTTESPSSFTQAVNVSDNTTEADANAGILTADQATLSTITMYGTRTVSVVAGDTLESIALAQFGNVTYAQAIALLNSITCDDDLVIGQSLVIPVIVPSEIIIDNRVYAFDKTHVLGIDILLNSAGQIGVDESGDFSPISGSDNIIQALNMRLNTMLGERLRLTVYGLAAAIGKATNDAAPVAFILANLKDTVMQDPRIREVKDIKLRGVEDALYISMTIVTISDVVNYSGVL